MTKEDPCLPSLNYDSPNSLRSFLDSRSLVALKQFGQNFLINRGARERLVEELDAPSGGSCWEVGAGLGSMTTLLLERGLELSAFEIDYGFISILKEFFGSYRNFTLIEGDVMRTWEEVNPPGDYFLGNLPYNIGAALLAVLIEKNRLFKRMVVTIQKEVAARILAGVGSKDYSPLSILCASVYTVRPVLTLKGAAFYPPPRVDSQALRFEERADKPFYPPLFKTLVRHIFGARRKTIKNNLQSFLVSINMDGNTAAALLNSCGIDCQERPERIAIEEYIALAKLLSLDAAGGTDCAPEGLARQDT